MVDNTGALLKLPTCRHHINSIRFGSLEVLSMNLAQSLATLQWPRIKAPKMLQNIGDNQEMIVAWPIKARICITLSTGEDCGGKRD